MKVNVTDENGNVQVRTTAAALAALGLRPFGTGTYLTARGSIVNPTGAGWAWICPLGADQSKARASVFEDLCELEAAEKVRKRA